jgi:hypothetical protein
MPSERQIAANRRNAKKSSGPRTADGKARSRRNSLRHGLSVTSGMIPAFEQDVVVLARALSLVDDDIGAALIAAEAEIDLLRIRQHRATLIEGSRTRAEPPCFDLADKLNALERYERRAFSRRNRAFRAMAAKPALAEP